MIDFGSGKKATPKKKKKVPQQVRVGVNGDPEDRPLTTRQEMFCEMYVKLNNARQAAIEAGYNPVSAASQACANLRKPNVARRIKELCNYRAKDSIATSQEVMEFFTKAMRGEMKDQFGLDMTAADRTKAAIELAKRTVDLDNKMAGKADNVVEIKLDWKR